MDGMISAPWRKSSYSGNNGGACVEVATWRKSTYSGSGNTSECVEVATGCQTAHHPVNRTERTGVGNADSRVLIRDTTNRAGAVLDIPATAWDHFTATLR